MQKERKQVKSMSNHGFSQFELTSKLLQNLNNYEITPTAKLVLLYLSSCYNPKKADMFPKQKTIAVKLGVSERSVVRGVQELIKAGLILVECKYSNRYKFGSNIVIWSEKSNKNFYSDNMSDDISQNDTLKDDNLSLHDKEQTKEHKKEQTSVEDYKILKEYATKKKAKNIEAYIFTLKRNGSASSIIQEYKTKQARKLEVAKLKEEEKRQEAEQKAELEKIKNEPPLTQTYNKESGFAFCVKFGAPALRTTLYSNSSLAGCLVKQFNFDINTIIEEWQKTQKI